MERKLIVSPSPHIHSGNSTQKLMLHVIIALLPTIIMSTIFYGIDILILSAVAVIACVSTEWIISKFLLKKDIYISDLSAILTGLLLALNLPTNIPLWLVIVGSIVAIGIGKMTYGGIGQNLFNPALVGRVFLLIAFPVQMTTFPEIDANSGATPLAYFKEAVASGANLSDLTSSIPISDIISNLKRGSAGEASSLALLAGLVYLLYKKVITWHIPISIIGTVALFSGIMYAIDPTSYLDPITQIFIGGLILGAVFMATDYTTSPMSYRGMLVYGVLIGLITIFVRIWGAYPEGISFAILIMNAFVPLINKYIKPKHFGEKVKRNF